jgi:AraC-like DNA-binding protein
MPTADDDLLSLLIDRVRLRGRVYARPTVCGEWQINPTGKARASYHLIARGECWLHMRHLQAPLALRSGDLMFFPADDWHVMSAGPQRHGDGTHLPDASAAPYTQLVCGLYDADDSELARLLAGLPALLLIRSNEGGARLAQVVQLLAEEGESELPGSAVILDAISNVLLALVLRHCVEHGLIRQGLLAGLGDGRLGPALLAMHAEPGKEWRLEALAARAALSRSAFAERFHKVLGSSPGQYLAELRMSLASARLRAGSESVAQIAEQLGYETETAFRRAFRRITGRTPGEVRREAQPSVGAS